MPWLFIDIAHWLAILAFRLGCESAANGLQDWAIGWTNDKLAECGLE